jgi:hypothetical protein
MVLLYKKKEEYISAIHVETEIHTIPFTDVKYVMRRVLNK